MFVLSLVQVAIRNLVDSYAMPCFAVSERFIFFEQFITLKSDTIITLMVAALAVLVVSCVG